MAPWSIVYLPVDVDGSGKCPRPTRIPPFLNTQTTADGRDMDWIYGARLHWNLAPVLARQTGQTAGAPTRRKLGTPATLDGTLKKPREDGHSLY